VAAVASRGHGVVLAQPSALVAVVAGSRRVRAREREPVHVLIDLGNGDLPPADSMAILAGGAHAAAVDIGMAAGAPVANIREHHFGMAAGTGDAFMQAAQGEMRLAVVKLGHGPDRLPAIDGVAVLTGKIQVAMGAARVRPHLGLGSRDEWRQQKPPDQPFCNQTWRDHAPAPLLRI
jgi:hypothetical protein